VLHIRWTYYSVLDTAGHITWVSDVCLKRVLDKLSKICKKRVGHMLDNVLDAVEQLGCSMPKDVIKEIKNRK